MGGKLFQPNNKTFSVDTAYRYLLCLIFILELIACCEGPSLGQNAFGAALAQIDHTFLC